MKVCDGHKDGHSADERTDAPGNTPGCSLHPLDAHDEKQSSQLVFPVVIYLLTKHNQELMDFSLKPSVTKLMCMRTSSNGLPPDF
ncbi:hypothetical protein EXN66_Car019565 [Channa argus]|uniref:Uncharacterized protein n=1 Tax=Channa argus TaxID=215402 RepID=A0A6G1QN28_CHAAH|nr:hypothetical protein EXN66_Car019565 [Channa argus]